MDCPVCHFETPEDSNFCQKCGTSFRGADGLPGPQTTLTLSMRGLELPPGQTVAEKYKIVSELGRGGMGIVYKAEDIRLKRAVALKFLRPELLVDPEAKSRFLLEAQVAAAIDHPNICSVYEVNDFQGQTFIALPFIEGTNLRDKLKEGPIDLKSVLAYGVQIADGLAEAHRKGIIHRDIKPANIMVTAQGLIKIMDFGLAKLSEGNNLTITTKIMGTAAYMSPEQAKGTAISHHTDIWSLGASLYEMLTGITPFETKREQAIIYAILHEWPKPLREVDPVIPASLEAIVDRCLQKDPESRYPTAAELSRDLKTTLDAVVSGTKEKVVAWKVKRRRSGRDRSSKGLWIALAGGAALLAVAAILFLGPLRKAPAPAQPVVPAPAAAAAGGPPPATIQDVAADGRGLSVEFGAGPAAEPGAAGILFAKKDYDRDKSKRIIGKFVLTGPRSGPLRPEIIEQFGPIARGDYAEILEEPQGTLILRAEPAEAEILVDGVVKGRTEVKLILPPKTYRVLVRKGDFMDRVEDIPLRAKEIAVRPFRLVAKAAPAPQMGSLFVDSSPQGAQVYLDAGAAAEGVTPLNLTLAPGLKHRVRLVLKEYEEKSAEVLLRGGQSDSQTFSLVPLPVELGLFSNPSDAEVYLNGKTVPDGRTPFRKPSPPASYKIRIHKEGYTDAVDELVLAPGKPESRTFELRPVPVAAPPKNKLFVDSVPEKGAKILVNGRDMGVTPNRIEIADSQVKLQLEKPGFKSASIDVVFTEPEIFRTVTLETLGKGKLTIGAYPPARFAIDGVMQDKPVPPERTLEVFEGVHQIKFVFSDGLEFVMEALVRPGGTERVYCNESEQSGSQTVAYELSNYPIAKVAFDGGLPFDSPPSKTIKAGLGPHRAAYSFALPDAAIAAIIHDQAPRGGRKKIHVTCEGLDFAALRPEIAREAATQGDADVLFVLADDPVRVDVAGLPRGEASAQKALKVQLAGTGELQLGLHPAGSRTSSTTTVWFLRPPAKRSWKVMAQIELLR